MDGINWDMVNAALNFLTLGTGVGALWLLLEMLRIFKAGRSDQIRMMEKMGLEPTDER